MYSVMIVFCDMKEELNMDKKVLLGVRSLKLQLGPSGCSIFWAEHNDGPPTLTYSPKNLVQDGIADDKVSDMDAAAVSLVLLQLGPQGSLHEVLVVVGVGDEDVVFEVPVLREAIDHPGKRAEAELKIRLLLQDQGKDADNRDCIEEV